MTGEDTIGYLIYLFIFCALAYGVYRVFKGKKPSEIYEAFKDSKMGSTFFALMIISFMWFLLSTLSFGKIKYGFAALCISVVSMFGMMATNKR